MWPEGRERKGCIIVCPCVCVNRRPHCRYINDTRRKRNQMSLNESDNNELSIMKPSIDLDVPNAEFSDDPGQKLSFLQGLGVVIGLQIGSGIFSSPNVVHMHAGSYGASLGVWILSGLLAWSGASCYCELGCAIPVSGGTASYLKRIYSNYAGFLFSWTAISVLKPGSAAIIALVLGEYLTPHPIYSRVCAIIASTTTSVINLWGHGASVGIYFLILKLALSAYVFIMCAVVGSQQDLSDSSIWGNTNHTGEIVAALFAGLWAYDGWDNSNFLTGDMKNPKKDLCRVISTAMPVVISTYCVVNCGYFLALSSKASDSATSVALTVARHANSTILIWSIRIGIALSCAGASNATSLGFIKLIRLAAEETYLPKFFQKPWSAVFFQFIVTTAYVCAGEFHSLVLFYGASGYIFYLSSVIGMLILRYKEPSLERPYCAWLVAPVVFICLSMTSLARTTYSHPIVMSLVLAFVFSGSPWYFYCTRNKL